MNPLPERFTNRWLDRVEPEFGVGTVCWHILVGSDGGARAAAEEAQTILTKFPGMHLTPRKWLHITTLIAGSTNEISREQMELMVTTVERILDSTAPIEVSTEKVLYHPEAVALKIEPAAALRPLLDATREATFLVLGYRGAIDNANQVWIPHLTVSYSAVEQPSGPIISTLGRSIRRHNILIDSLALVVQWGAERLWDWELAGAAHLGHR